MSAPKPPARSAAYQHWYELARAPIPIEVMLDVLREDTHVRFAMVNAQVSWAIQTMGERIIALEVAEARRRRGFSWMRR